MFELKSLEDADRRAERKSSEQSSGPSASVTAVHTVVRDGWYNMPTDLIEWKDYYWLSYRRSTGHNSTKGNSSVIVLRSNDLQRWQFAKMFEPAEGYVGKLGIAAGHWCSTEDRLYIFCPVQQPQTQGRIYGYWTEDGVNWSEPQLVRLGDDRPYTWRVRIHDGTFYSAVCLAEGGPLELIMSDDGAIWKKHTKIAERPPADTIGFTEESDLIWRPDGELWCVVRTGGAYMYWSNPPYTDWDGGTRIDMCDAPALCELDGTVFVAGRCKAPKYSSDTVMYPQGTTGLYHLTRGATKLLAAMPPGGDSSYPGLISPEPGKLAMSYYSDVAYWSGIIKPQSYQKYEYKSTDCDIYLAEIEVTDR